MITVQRVESDAGFRDLHMEWDTLLGASARPSVFRSWAWQHAWWKHFRGEKQLRIFVARDASGALVGLAPLCLAREGSVLLTQTLRFLGTERVSSEYLDILVAADAEEEVPLALLEAIESNPEWDVLALTDLPEGAAALRTWLPRLQSRGFEVERSVSQEIPYLPLPDTTGELRHRLGHSLRGAVSRATRKVAAAGYTYRVEIDPAALPEGLERLFELHAARWAIRNRPGNFRDERVRGFHRSLVDTLGREGGMRLGMLRNGERIIAVLYALEQGGTTSYYQSGFDPALPHPSLRPTNYSPGLVLIGATVEDAVERGLVEFDFLRGDEPYKQRWTHARRRTWALTAVRQGAWRAKSRLRLKRWVRTSRSRVKHLIRRGDAGMMRPTARRPAVNGHAPPRPIRVMHVVEELQLAGMEYGVIKVVNRLPGTVQGSICCLRHQAEVTKAVVDPRVRIVALGQRTGRNYRLIGTLASVFRREGIDVVHSHNWQTYLYAVLGARLAGVPVVIHGEHGHDDLASSWRRRWIQRALAPLVTRFLAVSENLSRELQNDWKLATDRIQPMPNGVDLARFSASADGAAIRRELSLTPEDEILISVGGIRRIKDHATLLRAFARVRVARPNARLLLVGAVCDPALRDELMRLGGDLGILDHVRFTGVRRDVPELLAASDVYVNTSRFEGMSNTILEAMAMRKPVVATQVGGNAELVVESVTGHLAPAGDAEAIAGRVVSLLGDPVRRRELGEAGRAIIERSHCIDAMVARYARVYESCYDHWWVEKTEVARK